MLLLVAIAAEEEALHAACAELNIAVERRSAGPVGAYFDLGVVGRDRVFAARTKMGAIRHEGSAYKAIVFQRATQATSIIQVGMAFGGDPSQQNIGDVLIARHIFPYDDRIIRAESGMPVVDYSETRRRAANGQLIKLFEREIRRRPRAFETHVGPMLSGGARIFCREFRDELVRSTGEQIIGGDMEGIGLLSVSRPEEPRWAVVKGVSDFCRRATKWHDRADTSSRLQKCRPLCPRSSSQQPELGGIRGEP